MAATPSALAMLSRRDEDAFDPIFDHLLVLDHGGERELAQGHLTGPPHQHHQR
mgnify:CR=1 FL=1